MKTLALFLLLPIGALILYALGANPDNQVTSFLMAAAIVAVGACIVRFT